MVPYKLTRTQLEIAKQIASGMTCQKIADQRFRALRTIEAHASQIRDRTYSETMPEAIYKLTKAQLI